MDQDKKEEQKKKQIKNDALHKEAVGKECPHCHNLNESEAMFCAECGYDFAGARHCPKCGTRIASHNADICESCGEWLLEGKCMFCYSDIEEGQTYCSECGNPVAGIVCPQCGRVSYFDFCKYCNIPLTAIAKKMLEEVQYDIPEEPKRFQSNQEARRYYMAQQYLYIQKTKRPEKISSGKDQLLKLKTYLGKSNIKKKKNTFVPLFSEKQKESIKSMSEIADKELERQEIERKKQEEERIRQEEERKKQDEERKRQEEEEEQEQEEDEEQGGNSRGWVCNAYGAFHPGGPCECADPSQGGHWVDSED